MDDEARNLRAYERLSRAALRLTPVNILDCVKEAIARNRSAVDETDAVIEQKTLDYNVIGHEETIIEVLGQFISNALKFNGENPPAITISARREADRVTFAVTDSGIGVAPEHHERMLGESERLNGDRYPGAGFGLAIAARGVEKMRGRLSIESVVGKGSTFSVELPVA